MSGKMQPGLTRRDLLRAGGGLTVAVLASGGLRVLAGEAAGPAQAAEANAWVSIAPDGTVTLRVAATEMGQGVMTSLAMILAEELDADWSRVRTETVAQDPEGVYGNPRMGGLLLTAGSVAVQGYFDTLRRAGAAARQLLIRSAARAWEVPPEEVSTAPGEVLHEASGRRLGFGEVAALPLAPEDVSEPAEVEPKPRSAYRLIGGDLGRLDIPGKVRGETRYSLDVRLPGMTYAAKLFAPLEGERPETVEDAAARALPGVVDVVPLPDGVAVVAERWETALAARDLLTVTWTAASAFREIDSARNLAELGATAADAAQGGTVWESRGDAPAALAAAGPGRILEADFTTDHLYHAQMEPLNAVASVDPDGKGAEVWIGTQSQTIALGDAARALGTTPDRIRLHPLQMGGAFGRRGFFTREVLHDALILSRSVGRPVKLIWTREDDVRNGWFRPATAHRLRAALDAEGRVLAWHHRVASPSVMAYMLPARWAAGEGRDHLVMEGSERADYAIPNLLTEHLVARRPARVSPWRGIGWGPNLFASECFLDELAEAAGSDPVAFRRRLLAGNPRGLAVLEAVVAMAGTPAPGRAQGLAFASYKTTLGAGIAEVSLERDSGRIRVHRFWAAIDAGLVVHPRNLEAQVEGGIVFGLSGLLKERVTLEGGQVQQSNFYDYEILRMDEVPEVEVKAIDSGEPPSGAGEIGVPMTSAAVANAVWALAGVRLRHAPFRPERVLEALAS